MQSNWDKQMAQNVGYRIPNIYSVKESEYEWNCIVVKHFNYT